MRIWRLGAAAALLALVGLPLLLPFGELLARPGAWGAWRELDRLLPLARNTALLTAGTLLVTIPVGVPVAVFLYRSNLPARAALRAALLLGLFIPLPVYASAWQAAFGGLLPFWPGPGWRPWEGGMLPAVLIHSFAALPWVVWLTGQGLRRAERGLEEEGLLAAGAWGTLRRVTLPQAAPALGLAALWVAVQTATEISVTDVVQVRTFAEEVYLQFWSTREGLAGAVAVTVPWLILTAALAFRAVRGWERRRPAPESASPARELLRLGPPARWATFGLFAAALLALLAAPAGSLVWKAGGGGPGGWGGGRLAAEFGLVLRAHAGMLLDSLFWALAAGALAAGLALVGCWLARDCGWFRALLVALVVLAWVLPGPVVGIGLKEVINLLMDLEDAALGALGVAARPVREVLYARPTPLPVLWVSVVRMFPYAAAVLWPAVKTVPDGLRELVRTEGGTPGQELRRAVWPFAARAFGVAAVAAGVLALGELSAGILVQVPGRQTFAQELFNQMHYGVGSTLAALCLVQAAVTALGCGLVLWLARPLTGSTSPPGAGRAGSAG